MNLAKLKHALLILSLAFWPCLANANSFFGGQVQEKDITFDDNVVSEIEKAFLYSEKEKMAIKTNDDIVKNRKNYPGDEDKANKFGFEISTPKYKVDLDKKAQEKLAYNAYINGQYEVAIVLYKKIIADYPLDQDAKYSLAMTYQKLKQYKSAKKIYFDLLKNDANNKEDIVANLVMVLSEESPNEAIFILTKLSRQNPDSGYFLAQKAVILDKMGNNEMAIHTMKEAIMKEPARVDYKFNLAVMYDKCEKFKDALNSYYEVVQGYQTNDSWSRSIPIEQVKSRIQIVKTFI